MATDTHGHKQNSKQERDKQDRPLEFSEQGFC